MEHKLYFRKSALSGVNKLILERDYFDVFTVDNEYYSSETFSAKLEYTIFKMISEVWRRRKAAQIYKIKINVEKDDKRLLRLIVRHCRKSWQAMKNGNELLAKYEFKCAESEWLRFGIGQMSNVALAPIMKMMKASADGRKSITKRWQNKTSNKNRDKNIKDAIKQGESIVDLASTYGISTRRVHQIKKT